MVSKLKYTRNIGFAAHIDAGKTTTTERILFYTGINHKLGEVHEGTATMDWMEQEQERGITITSAATRCEWQNNDKIYKINIIDTPGHVDFTVEVERSLRILDGLVILFSAVDGVEPQSENIWLQADKYKVPRICFINKMDRKGASFFEVCDQIEKVLETNCLILQIPIGKEESFQGIVDIISKKAFIWNEIDFGRTLKQIPIPSNLIKMTEEYRKKMIERLAEYDCNLFDKYFDSKNKITEEDIRNTIKKHTLKLEITPVICGSAFKNKGVQYILDAICRFLPSPLESKKIYGYSVNEKKKINIIPKSKKPFSALAFKISSDPFVGKLTFFRVYSGKIKSGSYVLNSRTNTKERISRIYQMHANKQNPISFIKTGDIGAAVGLKNIQTGDTLCDMNYPICLEKIWLPDPVIGLAIEPKYKSDIDKMSLALSKLIVEDPSVQIRNDKNTGQTIISGMGELHLEIIIDRMKREFNVEVNKGKPQVEYKEILTKKVIHREIYKKQTGGKGKYADIIFKIEPIKKEYQGLKFVNKVKGGNIPTEFIPSIEKGFKESLKNGPLAGYEIEKAKIILLDGSYHTVDSDQLSFELVSKIGFKNAAKKAKPYLLEPFMKVEVFTHQKYLGIIVGDINRRRGVIQGMEDKRKNLKLIKAIIPLSEMFGYVTSLRTLSSGRATSIMMFSHYQKAPEMVCKKIIYK
ncbi:elongation factor G [Candidatus Karelsulcia muelleri]|uniref:elongation factor G n=1 Tax=Candidatus Karelsulcia muelleri TaxID=336810 RepID=UPI0023644B38|nr:elongation factor G [Candidatus Karelsulcia muelleri]WDE42243.1 elongation factor G [Candidatus Karelsulcia muelleri]WDR79090.1 elongation factor G [Candidatus Karelsulcia muelleri]